MEFRCCLPSFVFFCSCHFFLDARFIVFRPFAFRTSQNPIQPIVWNHFLSFSCNCHGNDMRRAKQFEKIGLVKCMFIKKKYTTIKNISCSNMKMYLHSQYVVKKTNWGCKKNPFCRILIRKILTDTLTNYFK